MSILFEAWRRARGEGEEVARALGAPPAVQVSAGRALPWILCAAFAAAAAGLGVYLWRVERPAPRPAPRVAAMPAPAAPATAHRAAAPADTAGRTAAARPRHRAAATAAGARAAHGAAPSAAAGTGGVPEAVRAALPPLPVTVHVWNPAPAKRFVVVAGHIYHEGEEIAPGVRLVEITRGGELVRFRGYELSVGGT